MEITKFGGRIFTRIWWIWWCHKPACPFRIIKLGKWTCRFHCPWARVFAELVIRCLRCWRTFVSFSQKAVIRYFTEPPRSSFITSKPNIPYLVSLDWYSPSMTSYSRTSLTIFIPEFSFSFRRWYPKYQSIFNLIILTNLYLINVKVNYLFIDDIYCIASPI